MKGRGLGSALQPATGGDFEFTIIVSPFIHSWNGAGFLTSSWNCPAANPDVHPAVLTQVDEAPPEPVPRSKPPSITPKPLPPEGFKQPVGPSHSFSLSPTSPTITGPLSTCITGRQWDSGEGGHLHNKQLFFIPVNCFSDESAEALSRGPLPPPRLKRAPTEQQRENSSPAGPSSPDDGSYLSTTADLQAVCVIRSVHECISSRLSLFTQLSCVKRAEELFHFLQISLTLYNCFWMNRWSLRGWGPLINTVEHIVKVQMAREQTGAVWGSGPICRPCGQWLTCLEWPCFPRWQNSNRLQLL